MASNPNVGDPNLEGAAGNQPPVSPEQGQSIAGAPQGSQEFLDLKKRLDLTEKELKGLQSRQDKDKNETQRFMDELRAHMAKGMSLDEAEKAVTETRKGQEKDDLLYKIAEKVGVLNSSSQTPAGNGGTATEAAARVISELQLNANSADVLSILAKGLDPDEQELELRRYAARSKPQPSAAESSTMQSAASTANKSPAQLEKEYQEAATKIAQTMRGDQKHRALAALKVKYRAEGLQK